MTLPGREDLKNEDNRTHWSSIFNHAVPELDEAKCDAGTGRYTSTKISGVAIPGEPRQYSVERALVVLDVWQGCAGNTIRFGVEFC